MYKKGLIILTDKELFDDLTYTRKNVYEVISDDEIKEMNALCDEYRSFLDNGKTERECVTESIKIALNNFKK